MGLVYFYPEKFHPQTSEPYCNPIPHCRKECVYRTIQNMPNNGDLLALLFLMYGPDIHCAPPNFLLVVPGGLTLEKYHETIDQKLIINQEEPYIRSFMAPLFVSCTLFKNHQLVNEAVAYIDQANDANHTTPLGPTRVRDDSELTIIPLEPKKLANSLISQVFQVDPNSFNRSNELRNNPHMK